MQIKQSVLAVIPVFNDSASAMRLCDELLEVFSKSPYNFNILLVDDGSSTNEMKSLLEIVKLSKISIVSNNKRMGSQAAIHFGIISAAAEYATYNILVMDADGEDKPEDALILADELFKDANSLAILAQRGYRSAGLKFRIGYKIFKVLFKLITNVNLDIGNFAIIRNTWIHTLVNIPTAKNHISMNVIRYCPEYKKIRFNRGKRYSGKSKMNFSNLTLHGYAALSVFADVAFSRILLGASLLISFFYFSGLTLIGIKLFVKNSFITGWTSSIVTILLGMGTLLIIQVFTSTLLLIKMNGVSKD